MPLTLKQALFVKEYLVDKNATRAATAAGYSAKTAGKIGSENLSKPEIQVEIEKGFAAQVKKVERRAAARGMTRERWLAELEAIAMANMDDYAQVETYESRFNGIDGEPGISVRVMPVLTNERKRSLGRAIKKLSETKNGIGIELHSKQAALDTLGKHYGWVKEQVDLRTPDGGVQVIITMPSNGREATQENKEQADVQTAPTETPSPDGTP